MVDVEGNKGIARREIEEFEGQGNRAVAGELFAPGYVLHFPGFPALDLAGHERVLGGFREGFPDLHIEIAGQVAAGDRVASHWVARGTHRGPFQGIPATGKTVHITGNNVMRIHAGRVAELWGQLDAVGLLVQLGVVPAPPPEAGSGEAPGARAGAGGAGSASADPAGGSANAAAGARALDVVRRFVDRFNEGRLDVIADDFDDAYVLDFPGGPAGTGKEGLRRATAEFRAAFPDLRFVTEDLFGEGEHVAWRWHMTGTHRGPLGPFAASGKSVRLEGISLLDLAAGRIVRDRVRADVAGMLVQMGVIPGANAG